MGKPFKNELTQLEETIRWASLQDVSELRAFFQKDCFLPLLSIGSGGSFSACYYSSLLYEQKYQIAKALTPFDFFTSKQIVQKCKVLFISASGKNTDIQFALKKAQTYGAVSLSNLSMSLNNPIENIIKGLSNSYSSNYDLPSGKDGFLATNSLVAFFMLLYKSYYENEPFSTNLLSSLNVDNYIDRYLNFSQMVSEKLNFTVLYGSWGQPVAYDIESKCTEAALGAVQVTDYRNFGHGRHHWFDKQKETSSIIAIVTPNEKEIAEKTLSLIPKDIPRLIIETEIENALGSLDLLIKSFYLISLLGVVRNIDPGKPGVPEFGRKLYNLKYSSLYKAPKVNEKSIAIERKAHVISLDDLSEIEVNSWSEAYLSFVKKIKTTEFSGIVFDYDGTLSSIDNRYSTKLESKIIWSFVNLLQNGIKIAIVSGRGKSIGDLLRNSLPEDLWGLVYVGYYNGADYGLLSDDSLPNVVIEAHDSLKMIAKYLEDDVYILNKDSFEISLRPYQLTIKTNNLRSFKQIKVICNQIIITENITNLCLLESSHSMDLIIRPSVSKLNIISSFFPNQNVLCIGDKGLYPGNDFELLATPFSLSVDEVSYNSNSCWNLAPKGLSNMEVLHHYLGKITISNNSSFTIKI